ncbi:hypothetical protein GGF31_000354 [Allomyces arbusculus]|nr:hypothetical protein GGF31_000354 [Allomyces arbusculus]
MAEELTKALKSSAVPAAEKLALAQHAFRDATVRIPHKADVLADWTINAILKSRTWEQKSLGETPLLAPVYWTLLSDILASPSLAASNLSTIKAPLFQVFPAFIASCSTINGPDADTMRALTDAVVTAYRRVAVTLEKSPKVSLEAWASLIRNAIKATAVASVLVTLAQPFLDSLAHVLELSAQPKKNVGVVCSLLSELAFASRHGMDTSVKAILTAGLFSMELVQEVATSCAQYVDHIAPVASQPTNKRVRPSTSASKAPVIVFPELAKAIRALNIDDLTTLTPIIFALTVTKLTEANAAISTLHLFAAYIAYVDLIPSEHPDRYILQSQFLAVLIDQGKLRMTDDRDDWMATTLAQSLLINDDTAVKQHDHLAVAAVERFVMCGRLGIKVVDMVLPPVVQIVAHLANQRHCRTAALVADLIDLYAQSRALNVLVEALAQVGNLVANRAVLLADSTVLDRFAEAMVDLPTASWFTIFDALFGVQKATTDATASLIIAAYLHVLLDAIPLSPAFQEQRQRLAETVLQHVQSQFGPAAIHLHLQAIDTLVEYRELLLADEAMLTALAQRAVGEAPWIGAAVVLQTTDLIGSAGAMVPLIEAAVGAFSVEDLPTAESWSGVLWEVDAPQYMVYWWMTLVQFFDQLGHSTTASQQQAIAELFVTTLDPTSVGASAFSMASVSTEVLYSAMFYELSWLRPHVVEYFKAGITPPKLELLVHFPGQYFAKSDRDAIAAQVVGLSTHDDAVRSSIKQVLISLEATLPEPLNLLTTFVGSEQEQAATDVVLAYQLAQKSLVAHNIDARRQAALRLLRDPIFPSDPLFAHRLLADWLSSKSATALRDDLTPAIFATNVTDPLVQQARPLLQAAVSNADITTVAPKSFLGFLSAVLDSGDELDPLVVRAIELHAQHLTDANDLKAAAQHLLEYPVSAASLSHWLTLVHVYVYNATRHPHAVKQVLRALLKKILDVAELVVSVAQYCAVMQVLERTLDRLGRLTVRVVSQVLLVVSHLTERPFAERFFAHIPIAAIPEPDRVAMFNSVARVLSAILQHQRRAILDSPAMLCIMIKDMLLAFLEPGRFARKDGTTDGATTTGTTTLPVSLGMPVLTVFAPLPLAAAQTWERLVASIPRLSAAMLLSLRATSSAQLVKPFAVHVAPIVTQFILYQTFNLPAHHPRFGWAIADARVKQVLVQGLYALLDLQQQHDLAYLLQAVPNSAKQAVKELVADHDKYHKYHGKI